MENPTEVELGTAAVPNGGSESESPEPAHQVAPAADQTIQATEQAEGPTDVGTGASGDVEHSGLAGEVDDEKIEIDPAILDRMTTGVLGLFLPNLQRAKGSLNEVLHNQEVLIETLQQENSKFSDSVEMGKLADTMSDAQHYRGKLVNLKREMATLMDKSTKLKRRAVRLQQNKQREELQRAAQQERELEKERMLTAKVARQRSASSETT